MGKIPPPPEIGRAAMLQRNFGSPYKYLREEVTLLWSQEKIGSIFLRLPVATGDQDEAFHRNGSLRCVTMRLRAMPRQVNVSVRRAIVVVQTRSIEYNGCASAGRRGLG